MYTWVILFCAAQRPLWLDEILQLIRVTAPNWRDMVQRIPNDAGAVPFGYLTQRPFALLGAPWPLVVRLPSVLFSALSCSALILLCRELGTSRTTSLLAAGLFILTPSQFRSATEGRPYSEALFLVVLSLIALAKLNQQPNFPRALFFAGAVTAGLYTQPYTFFASVGASISSLTPETLLKWWTRLLIPILCLAIAVGAFTPWYLSAVKAWDLGIRSQGLEFHWSVATVLDLVKGVSGGSLLCSTSLIVLAALGCVSGAAPLRRFLSYAAGTAIAGALTADWFKGYFFASRQIIFALPALAVLAAQGFHEVQRKSRAFAVSIVGLFVLTALINDVKTQLNRREDWPAAARAIASISQEGYCVEVAGDQGEEKLYSWFVPELANTACPSTALEPRVALVSNMYSRAAEIRKSEDRLQAAGFTLRSTIAVGGTTIRLEERSHSAAASQK